MVDTAGLEALKREKVKKSSQITRGQRVKTAQPYVA